MEFIVNRDAGYPVDSPTHKLYEVIELDPNEGAKGVDAGYLIPVDSSHKLFTTELAVIVGLHRAEKKKRAELAAAASAAQKKALDDAEPKPLSDDERKQRAEAAAKADLERKANVEKILQQAEPAIGAPATTTSAEAEPIAPLGGTAPKSTSAGEANKK